MARFWSLDFIILIIFYQRICTLETNLRQIASQGFIGVNLLRFKVKTIQQNLAVHTHKELSVKYGQKCVTLSVSGPHDAERRGKGKVQHLPKLLVHLFSPILVGSLLCVIHLHLLLYEAQTSKGDIDERTETITWHRAS